MNIGWAISIAMCCLICGCSGPGPLDGDEVEFTPELKRRIEQQVRACGMNMQNPKWVRIEELSQWEFGFTTTSADFANTTKKHCVDIVALPADHSIMIAFSAPNG